MRIQINAHGFELSEELRRSVVHEIERLVQAVDRPVNLVAIQLYDDRGVAARGADKRCCVKVEFDDALTVEGSDTEASFHDCLGEACIKVMRAEQSAH
jgi:hypothetical protein